MQQLLEDIPVRNMPPFMQTLVSSLQHLTGKVHVALTVEAHYVHDVRYVMFVGRRFRLPREAACTAVSVGGELQAAETTSSGLQG